MAEYGDKIGADETAKIEAAVKDAEELLKQKDAGKDALEAKATALSAAAQKLGELMYAQAQAEAGEAGGAGGPGPGGGGAQGGEGGKHDEKVVDAEYTEVKDKK